MYGGSQKQENHDTDMSTQVLPDLSNEIDNVSGYIYEE